MAQNGKRKAIRLGTCSKKAAQTIKVHVEELLSARLSNHPVSRQTAEWLGGVDKSVRERLEAIGLVEPAEEKSIPLLGEWLEKYFAGRTDWKPATRRNSQQARDAAENFFGKDIRIDKITPGDAEDFRRHLLNKKLSENTVRRRCKRVKQFIAAAIKRKIIQENPFDGIPTKDVKNTERMEFIDAVTIEKVIQACPDAEWRLIFALSRWGGLRCPSEILQLKWEDIHWDQKKMTIKATKTEHHEGGGIRTCPIFPQLEPHLIELFELAESGAKYCIQRYRLKNNNLRTQAHRIIERAGIIPWPKPFQNLRSSRETDLCDRFSEHVVTKWLGNSPEVARRHYFQVTEEHFRRATEGGAESGAVEAHNQAQQRAAVNRSNSQEESSDHHFTQYSCGSLRVDKKRCGSLRTASHTYGEWNTTQKHWKICAF